MYEMMQDIIETKIDQHSSSSYGDDPTPEMMQHMMNSMMKMVQQHQPPYGDAAESVEMIKGIMQQPYASYPQIMMQEIMQIMMMKQHQLSYGNTPKMMQPMMVPRMPVYGGQSMAMVHLPPHAQPMMMVPSPPHTHPMMMMHPPTYGGQTMMMMQPSYQPMMMMQPSYKPMMQDPYKPAGEEAPKYHVQVTSMDVPEMLRSPVDKIMKLVDSAKGVLKILPKKEKEKKTKPYFGGLLKIPSVGSEKEHESVPETFGSTDTQKMTSAVHVDANVYKSPRYELLARIKRNTFINGDIDGSSTKDIISLLSATENLSVHDGNEYDSKNNNSDAQSELLSRLRSFISSSWKEIVSGDSEDKDGDLSSGSSDKQVHGTQKQQTNSELKSGEDSLSKSQNAFQSVPLTQTPPTIQYLLGHPQFTAPILQKVDDMSHLRIKPLRVAKGAPVDSSSSFHAQNNKISSPLGPRTNEKHESLPTILSIHDGTKSHQYTYVQTTEDVRSHSSLPTKEDAIVRLNSARSSRQEKLEQLREKQGHKDISKTSSPPVSTSLLKQAVLVSTRPRKRIDRTNNSPRQDLEPGGLENSVDGKSILAKGVENSFGTEQLLILNESLNNALPFVNNEDENVKTAPVELFDRDHPIEISPHTSVTHQNPKSSAGEKNSEAVKSNQNSNTQVDMQGTIGTAQKVQENVKSLVVERMKDSLKAFIPSKQIPFSIVILDQTPSKLFESTDITRVFKDGALDRNIDPNDTDAADVSSFNQNVRSDSGLSNHDIIADGNLTEINEKPGVNPHSSVMHSSVLTVNAAGIQHAAHLSDQKLKKKTLLEDGNESKVKSLSEGALNISAGKVLFKMNLPSEDLTPEQSRAEGVKSSAQDNLPLTMGLQKLLEMISKPTLPEINSKSNLMESLKSIDRHNAEPRESKKDELNFVIASKISTNSDASGNLGKMLIPHPTSETIATKIEPNLEEENLQGKLTTIVTADHVEVTTKLPTTAIENGGRISSERASAPTERESASSAKPASHELATGVNNAKTIVPKSLSNSNRASGKENSPMEKISTSSESSKKVTGNSSIKTAKAISSAISETNIRSSPSPQISVIKLSPNFSNDKNPIFSIFSIPGSVRRVSAGQSAGGTDLGKFFSLVARSAAAGVQAAAKASIQGRSG